MEIARYTPGRQDINSVYALYDGLVNYGWSLLANDENDEDVHCPAGNETAIVPE